MAKTRLYFFLNDQLHRRIAVNRGKDLLYAWNYPEHKRNTYQWSDALKRMEPAFRTREVAKMLHRDKTVVEQAVWRGLIPTPPFNYGLENNRMHSYMWREKDILGLLEYLSTIHFGRPRNDGLIVPKYLPTPREVRAMIRDDKVLYGTKDYVPSWRAKEIKGEK